MREATATGEGSTTGCGCGPRGCQHSDHGELGAQAHGFEAFRIHRPSTSAPSAPGKHALFSPLLPDDQRLAANSVLSTSLWSATIAGPALAGLLVGVVSPVCIIGLDAATFAVLAFQTI